ncbi:S1 family peptidase [Streptomyces clavifer]|uniref:S1 family peptidase n=1 Tax=Streptomyces clavifer TaxID=68188 RepID=UPI00308FE180|nr:S1 family peptidase [Streptomyces clavifer]
MRHARRGLQRVARLATVGALLCGGLMTASGAAGATTGGTSAPTEDGGGTTAPPPGLGERLLAQLGPSRTAGSWLGSDGRPVVAATDEAAAAEAERAGARAQVVRHSMRRLRSATQDLGRAPRVPGTAWAVDYASNRVLVRADSTVSAADWSRLSGLAEETGSFVHMQRTRGALSTRLSGAAPLFARNGRCSAGFNVTDGRRDFVLTAGHCGPPGTAWFGDARGTRPVGTTTAGRFPGGDFSLVAYGSGDPSGARSVVGIGGGREVRIDAAADPAVGLQVVRSGSTTGTRTGRVTALNATVNYPEGTVTGLIETTVCAEPGDSGGPLFAQGLALGVTSGGNGDCTTGGTTYFQPVTSALSALGVRLTAPAASPEDARGEASPPAAAGAAAPGGPGLPTASGGVLGIRPLAPGLLVLAASLLVPVAAGVIRSALRRRAYRRWYSHSWT